MYEYIVELSFYNYEVKVIVETEQEADEKTLKELALSKLNKSSFIFPDENYLLNIELI